MSMHTHTLHCSVHRLHKYIYVFVILRSLSCNYFFLLQDGLTPVALAFGHGHSELVDVLVKQYGCSISDVEKVKHVTYGMTCYHHSVMSVSYGMTIKFPCLHLNVSSHTSLPLLVIVVQTCYIILRYKRSSCFQLHAHVAAYMLYLIMQLEMSLYVHLAILVLHF